MRSFSKTKSGAAVAAFLLALAGAFAGDVPAPDAASAGVTSPANPWTRFLDILRDARIGYDRNTLELAALRGMLRTIDPRATVIDAAEAGDIRRRRDGYWPSGEAADSASQTLERIQPLRVDALPRKIARISVAGIYEGAGESWDGALADSAVSDAAAWILDLRQAGGRNLEALDRMAASFLDGGAPLYSVADGEGRILREGFAAAPAAGRPPGPVIVLTDGETVMASELLAAILRGAPGVMLLGERTSGDPRLRELYRWSDTHYLYLPEAFLKPARHPDYTLIGVMPHIVVRPERRETMPRHPDGRESDDIREDPFADFRDDAALARALEILAGLQAVDRLFADK